jgi:hypothetical protein
MFMSERSKSVPELPDAEWIFYLAFLINISCHLNKLETKLWEKAQLLGVFLDTRAFEMKLMTFVKSET